MCYHVGTMCVFQSIYYVPGYYNKAESISYPQWSVIQHNVEHSCYFFVRVSKCIADVYNICLECSYYYSCTCSLVCYNGSVFWHDPFDEENYRENNMFHCLTINQREREYKVTLLTIAMSSSGVSS